MKLTFQRAKSLLDKAEFKKDGVKLAKRFYLVRVKDKYIIEKRGIELLSINKKDEIQLGFAEGTDFRFLSKLTNATFIYKNKKWYIGRTPFYPGIKIDQSGDVLIPEVWSLHGDRHLRCRRCRSRYSATMCSGCNDNGW